MRFCPRLPIIKYTKGTVPFVYIIGKTPCADLVFPSPDGAEQDGHKQGRNRTVAVPALYHSARADFRFLFYSLNLTRGLPPRELKKSKDLFA